MSSALRLAAVTAFAWWFWAPAMLESVGLLTDEWIYARAGRFVRQGGSPYQEWDYIYPPFVAWLMGQVGAGTAILLLRWGIVLGMGVIGWGTAELVRSAPNPVKLVLGCYLATWFPGTWLLGVNGNLQWIPAVSLILCCLALEGRPHVAGIALGVGLALKPACVGVWACLALSERHRRAAVVAALAAAAVLAPHAGLFLEYLGTGDRLAGKLEHEANMSLASILHPDVPFASTFVLVLLVSWGATALREGRIPIGLVLGSVALFSCPTLWRYSWVVGYPALAVLIDGVITTAKQIPAWWAEDDAACASALNRRTDA